MRENGKQSDESISETPAEQKERMEREIQEVFEQDRRRAVESWRPLIDEDETILAKDAAALVANLPADPIQRTMASETDKLRQEYTQGRLEADLKKYIQNPSAPADERRVPMGAVLAWQRQELGTDTRFMEEVLGPFKHDGLVGTANYDLLHHYNTPLIDALIAAVGEYWVDFDPDTMDGPQKADVVYWLTHNFDMSESDAKAIDTIARHPARKRGGHMRKKR